MNKFKFYFILSIATLLLFSCSKNNDTPEAIPLRDHAVQYAADIADIETYLKTSYIDVTADQDVTITKIPSGGTQPSIWSYKDNASFPKLLSREVSLHGITYKLYYLVLREGVGQSPSNVDGVLAAYKGEYLASTTVNGVTSVESTFFEQLNNPQQMFNLEGVIKGWSEVFPQFKTGTYTTNPDGTVSYSDFGAGVVFIPSGLAYYNFGSGNIPAYAPLVFSFKLYEIQRLDQDGDGIPSYLEDRNGDGYMYDYRNTNNYPTAPVTNIDDTDGDGVPDFLDVDDDGDGYTTKLETKKPNGSTSLDGPSLYYPYDPIISNPSKSTDELRGIPAFISEGNYDYTSPNRLRLHLDKNHH